MRLRCGSRKKDSTSSPRWRFTLRSRPSSDKPPRGVSTCKSRSSTSPTPGDRKKALEWNVEILVNNAGLLEGGSVLDIPVVNMRREFEVNVVGPLLLTQGLAKQMVKRGEGRIVWVSSREGLNTNPFTGIYSASKHAVEAIAETMSLELQEFGIEVATVNPGPFLTGFNDRGFDTWRSWEDDPSKRLFDYSNGVSRGRSSTRSRCTPT